MYREISKVVLNTAIDNHHLEEWYECLSEEQKEQILVGLEERVSTLIDEHYKELDKFAVTSVILGNPPKPEKSKVEDIRSVFAKEPGLNFRIINHSNLSKEEVQEMAEELYIRMSDILGF